MYNFLQDWLDLKTQLQLKVCIIICSGLVTKAMSYITLTYVSNWYASFIWEHIKGKLIHCAQNAAAHNITGILY